MVSLGTRFLEREVRLFEFLGSLQSPSVLLKFHFTESELKISSKPISYPESSGFLVSGTLGTSNFYGKTMATVTEQPIKKIEFFRCPQSLPGVAPLTKKAKDSGYEIASKPISYPESSGSLVSG